MNFVQSFRIGVAAGLFLIVPAGACVAASSTTVVLETGYSDSGQPVNGGALPAAAPLSQPAFTSTAGSGVAGNAAETARIQPGDGAELAGSDPDAAFLTPGTLVVAPGSGSAPRARAQGPAAAADLSAPSLLFPALMALVAMAPLVGWLLVNRRRRRPAPARHAHRALAEALAATVSGEEPAGRKSAPGHAEATRRRTVAATPRDRDAARRELEEALRRGPEPTAVEGHDELVRLRGEVLDGLREMKARVTAFTEALEQGKSELQSELGRAHRAIELLRAEREGLDPAVRLAPRRATRDLVEPELETPRAAAPPVTFRPPRIESVPAAQPAPTLDPAWLLLEDEGDGLWLPEPAPTQRRSMPAAPAAPTGAAAMHAFARRNTLAADPEQEPRDRRRRIVEMARSGRTIDDISRELRVGRGEVTLALSRAR